MKKTIVYYFVLTLSIFCYACEKDVAIKAPDSSITPPIPPPSPDTITYTDITDISLISNYSPQFGCSSAPFPSDTIMFETIDIDLDGIYDMKFINTHDYNLISASSPCTNFNCAIKVEMINPIDTIAFYNNEYWWIDELYLNDTIDNDLNFNYFGISATPFISYHYYGGGPPGIHNFVGEKYLGFKLFRSGKTMFGWIRIESVVGNGVIIKDFAINKTDGNRILCGQTF